MRLSEPSQDDSTKGISIHAPLTGCDISVGDYVFGKNDFNPRTPYGMRR